MERPSDRRTALPAAPVAGIPRWRALLAGGIRRLVMGGTGLLAALAALLHDAVKERPKAELLQIRRGNAIIAGNAAESPAPVWHGPCAAIMAKTQWGVDDPEVLDAIRYHTTGRAGMTKMDKILYLADMISAERDYPEVGELRALAGENLDAAVLQAVRYNIRWMEECGKTIDPLSREALEDLERSAQAQKNTEV